eukprot:IDg11252t1
MIFSLEITLAERLALFAIAHSVNGPFLAEPPSDNLIVLSRSSSLSLYPAVTATSLPIVFFCGYSALAKAHRRFTKIPKRAARPKISLLKKSRSAALPIFRKEKNPT